MAGLRTIHRLRLAAAGPEAAREGVRTVEAALALASLPPAGRTGLLLIRRLDLGRLPRRAGPQTLALRLEAALAGTSFTTLTPCDPERPDAAAVRFPDRVSALASLALHLLAGRPPRAWYWHRILPALAEPPPALNEGPHATSSLLATIVEAAAAPPAGRAGLRALLRELADKAALHQFAAALPTAVRLSIAPALEEAGRPRPARLVASPVPAPATAPATSGSAPADMAPIDKAVPGGTASPASAAEASAIPLQPGAARVHGHEVAAGSPAQAGQPGPIRPGSRPEPGGRAVSTRTRAPSPRPQWGPAPGANTESSFGVGEARAGAVTAAGDPHRNLPGTLDAPEETPQRDTLLPFSPHAGLFLLVQAIHSLAIDRLCEADPFLPLRLLHASADRLGIARDDAARLALPERPDPSPEPAVWLAPTAWLGLLPGRGVAPPAPVLRPHGDGFAITDSASRLVLGRALSAEPLLARFGPAPLRRADDAAPAKQPVLLRSCQLALGRYLRRAALTSLRRLVRRPGRVVASRTHVDLLFTHDQAEIGPRRAGLDLDPGWVPWLGRVVSVHYLDPEEFAG